MIRALVQGKILKKGERSYVNKNGIKVNVPYVDLYLDNCGETIRVQKWSAPDYKELDSVILFVDIWHNKVGFSINFFDVAQ